LLGALWPLGKGIPNKFGTLVPPSGASSRLPDRLLGPRVEFRSGIGGSSYLSFSSWLLARNHPELVEGRFRAVFARTRPLVTTKCRIVKVLAVPVAGAYDCREREVAEAVSVGLVLGDGQVAWGDCVATANRGRPGRYPLFRAEQGLATVRRAIAPLLEGQEITHFRELDARVDALQESVEVLRPSLPSQPAPDLGGKVMSRRALLAAAARRLVPYEEGEGASQGQDEAPMERLTVTRQLHPAVRYGVSQALLKAVALARGVTMAEVVAAEWGLPRPDAPPPIHAQTGRERRLEVDKMIARRVASLPNARVEQSPEGLGEDGDQLIPYVRWLVARIGQLGDESYRPTLHLDVQGALGRLVENNLGRVLGELRAVEMAAGDYPLRVEDALIMGDREAQVEALKMLRGYLRFHKMRTQLVAGAWADKPEDIQAFVDAQAADVIRIQTPDLGGISQAVEAVLACKAGGVGALLGGGCGETDLSARVAVHVGLATRPDVLVAMPGAGVDEALMLVGNEMARALARIDLPESPATRRVC